MSGLLSSFRFFGHLGDITEDISASVPITGYVLSYDLSAPNGNGMFNIMVFG